jgi:hypothetical protein
MATLGAKGQGATFDKPGTGPERPSRLTRPRERSDQDLPFGRDDREERGAFLRRRRAGQCLSPMPSHLRHFSMRCGRQKKVSLSRFALAPIRIRAYKFTHSLSQGTARTTFGDADGTVRTTEARGCFFNLPRKGETEDAD